MDSNGSHRRACACISGNRSLVLVSEGHTNGRICKGIENGNEQDKNQSKIAGFWIPQISNWDIDLGWAGMPNCRLVCTFTVVFCTNPLLTPSCPSWLALALKYTWTTQLHSHNSSSFQVMLNVTDNSVGCSVHQRDQGVRGSGYHDRH